MKSNGKDRLWRLLGLCVVLVGLAACSSDDADGYASQPVRLVDMQLTVSLPQRIIGEPDKGSTTTRMHADIVQQSQDVAGFRGLEALTILCYDRQPQADTRQLDNFISLPDVLPNSLLGTTKTNHSVYQLSAPVGTTYMTVYGRAINGTAGRTPVTVADRMHYGILEVSGLQSSDYHSNDDIRFTPVQICPSTDALGNSSAGQALLALLNDLLNITGPEEAPHNLWSTTTNALMKSAYQAMTALRTSSSYHVESMLNRVYAKLSMVHADEPGGRLAAILCQAIDNYCNQISVDGEKSLQLKAQYQGFPADLHLPSGAARIEWDASQQRYKYPDIQAYGKELNVPALSAYVYPANLQYQIISPIMASDTLKSDDYLKCGTWKEVLDSLYKYSNTAIQDSTRSVAIVNQLHYGVGRLDSRVIMEAGIYYDAYGKAVDVSNGFTLKGYIIGGQHAVDYDFKPLTATPEYFIYDTDLNGGQPVIKPNDLWTPYNYTLGLETVSNQATYMALELVNNCDDFQGADGVIVHGATFYLVASLAPQSGSNYQYGVLDQIFRKDYATKANLSILKGWPDKDGDGVPDPDLDDKGNPKPIQGLATASYGLPNLESDVHMVNFGMSVNLNWERGFVFNDIVL